MSVVCIAKWDGCYDEGWRDLIVPAAFAHPAKMARGLVARIFDELFASGALARGHIVVDPFGGIGTTAIEGASRGVQVVCCELEPKFYGLATENFSLHARDWVAMRRPLPVVVNGDSRKLRGHIGGVLSWLVANPLPNGERSEHNTATDAVASVVVASPPYAAAKAHPSLGHPENDPSGGNILDRCTTGARVGAERYGQTPGQLGSMPEGEVDAIVSSPPFTQGYAGGGGINRVGYRKDGVVDDKVGARTYQGTAADRAPGNLETLTLGEVDAVVSSPAETFWSAALDIVRESYAVLRPGGTAVWVVKAFVRDKQRVDFPGDWRKLCESVGFDTYLEAHAMLVAEETRHDLFDGPTVTRRERKSFFRRLAEKKGSPRIDWETVYFMRKPEASS